MVIPWYLKGLVNSISMDLSGVMVRGAMIMSATPRTRSPTMPDQRLWVEPFTLGRDNPCIPSSWNDQRAELPQMRVEMHNDYGDNDDDAWNGQKCLIVMMMMMNELTNKKAC